MNTHDIEPLKYGGNRSDDYVTGWNDCYAAIEAYRKRRQSEAEEVCAEAQHIARRLLIAAVFVDGIDIFALPLSSPLFDSLVDYWHRRSHTSLWLTIWRLMPCGVA